MHSLYFDSVAMILMLNNICRKPFCAFGYTLLLIPLAAGALIPWTDRTLSLMPGTLRMSLSSFCVVSNALHLNHLALRDLSHDKKMSCKRGKNEAWEEVFIDMSVFGMMYPRGEAIIRNAFEVLPGVRAATADYVTGRVTALTTKKHGRLPAEGSSGSL